MSHARHPWTDSEVAETLSVAAKHTGTRGEKMVVHWVQVASELAARGGEHTRTASAIASHFASAGIVVPPHLAAAPHARYGDAENVLLLDLLTDPMFMYMRGSRVCQCVPRAGTAGPPPFPAHPPPPPPHRPHSKWAEIEGALAAKGFVRTVAAVKEHASKLREV